jgi:hypothetical protein
MSDAPPDAVVSRAPWPSRPLFILIAVACGWLGFRFAGLLAGDASTELPFPQAYVVWRAALGALVGASIGAGVVALVGLLLRRGFRRADAGGFTWRNALGPRRHAPWSDVVEVRQTVKDIGASVIAPVELLLADGHVVVLPDHWNDADALRARIARRSNGSAYRSGADDDPTRATFPYGSPRAQLAHAAPPLFGSAVAVFVCGPVVWQVLVMIERGGHGPERAHVAIALGTLAVVGSLWRRYAFERSGWRLEQLVVDREGVSVRGGEAPRRVAWRDVLAVADDGRRLHLMTSSAPIPVRPGLDAAEHFLDRVLREAPPAVTRAYLRQRHHRERLAPTERPDGSRRHHALTRAHLRGVAAWSAPAAFFAVFGIVHAILEVPEPGVWAVAGFAAHLPLLYVVWVLRVRVDVDAEGCTWRGLFSRRRFRWGDVAEARVYGAGGRALALALHDGAVLRRTADDVADGDLLIDAVRRHCAAVLREMP